MKDLASDKALQAFADLMIKKIEEVNEDPTKPWFSAECRRTFISRDEFFDTLCTM